MAKARKTKEKIETPEEATTSPVMMYKVCVPLWYAFGSQEIELAKFYNKVSAEEYIAKYYNIFARPYLFIKECPLTIRETD